MPPRRSTRATARKSTLKPPARKSAAKSAANESLEAIPSTAATTTATTIPESSACTEIATESESPSKNISKSPAANVSAECSTEVPAEKPLEATPLTSPTAEPSREDVAESPAAASLGHSSSKGELQTPLPMTLLENVTEKSPNSGQEASGEPVVEEASVPLETSADTGSVPETVNASGQEAVIWTAQKPASKAAGKTVVKKTVRIVKKVIKKKVPKRVQKGMAVCSNQKTGEKATPADDGENPSPRVLDIKVENSNPVEAFPSKRENFSPDPCFSVPKGVENIQSNVTLPEGAENPNASVANPNFNVASSTEVENPGKPDKCEGEKNGSLAEILSEAPNTVAAHNNETVSAQGGELNDPYMSAIGDCNDECGTENANSRGSDSGGVKKEVGKCEIGSLKGETGMCNGVPLSGEMEALERRRRRKTEIFIGGLDKDVKEEDIRKIFEEAGEIVELRLMMNGKTGKNKGFAFVRFASAADAKNALAKYPKVEICGKQCGTSLVEGNDTIFLGNIDKKWKSEDVLKMLQEIGIEKIDKVTVMADPNNIECSRGFAFLELETNKDAQNAYKKLQKKDVFGKHQKIKVAWAEPLMEPDEEEMLKVKSVYAEYIPSSWDEEKVTEFFKKFGEIENVVLARNLRSSRRKDFAFVNYATREAALACIEAFSCETFSDIGSKVGVKVSLAKPIPKGKQTKQVSNPVSKESSKMKHKVAQSVMLVHEPKTKVKTSSSNYENVRVDSRSSTTSELVQLLREQASWRQPQTSFGMGSVDMDYLNLSSGRKRPFSVLGNDPLYSDPRGYPRARIESAFPAASPSGLSQGIGTATLPYYRQGAGYAPGSLDRFGNYPSKFQTSGASYHGSSSLYHRFR